MSTRAAGRMRGIRRWVWISAPAFVAAELVFLLVMHTSGESLAPPVRQPSAATSGVDLHGNTVTLGSLRGSPAVVGFFASWCVPCRHDAPAFHDLAQRYRARVGFLSVAVDDPADAVRSFASRYGWTWPVVRDDGRRWISAFGPPGVPTTFLLDAQGRIVKTMTGAITEAEMTSSLDPMLRGT